MADKAVSTNERTAHQPEAVSSKAPATSKSGRREFNFDFLGWVKPAVFTRWPGSLRMTAARNSASPTAPPPVGTLYNSEAFPRFSKGAPYTLPFNLTGAPAASMPAGLTSAGLPVGLQIVGPARADHLVLRAMRAYESALGWAWPQPRVLETLAKL